MSLRYASLNNHSCRAEKQYLANVPRITTPVSNLELNDVKL